jgi:flagellar hook-length control protein FliK
MSPLDIFGAMAHSATPGAEPSPAFKALLNKPTPAVKPVLNRQPVQKGAAEQPPQDAPKECAPDRASAPSGKKLPAKTAPINRPQRGDDNRKPADQPAADQPSTPPATDSSQSPPQPQDPPTDQDGVADDGTEPVDPANKPVLGDNADAVQPLVALAEQTPDSVPQSQPNASADASAPAQSDATVPGNENSAPVDKPALQLNAPQTPDVAPPSPQDHTSALAGNSPLSPAEPEQDSAKGPDPIAAIDQQTAAAATVEIQPVDSSGKNKDDKSSDSSGSDGSQQNGADTPQQITPSPDVLTNQGAQSGVVPPPTTDSTSPLPKDANPPPPTGNSQQTAGVQPTPSRLPQHVLTRGEGHRIHNPAPVPVDTARFLSRVAKAFLSAQQRDGNEIRLRLSPPELGSLRLQVSVQNGVMVARMETETEAARSSLVNNLPDLRERLAEQGIRVERFDIDLMQRPSTGTPDRPSDPQQQNEPQPLRPLRSQQATSEGPAPTTVGNNWSGQGRLNVII